MKRIDAETVAHFVNRMFGRVYTGEAGEVITRDFLRDMAENEQETPKATSKPTPLQQRRETVKAIGRRFCPGMSVTYHNLGNELDAALNEVERAVKDDMCANHTQCRTLLHNMLDHITATLDFADGKVTPATARAFSAPVLGLDLRSLQQTIRELLK